MYPLSMLTWPVTSVSADTPFQLMVTFPSLAAAHFAPASTCVQKSKPTAFGTTARVSAWPEELVEPDDVLLLLLLLLHAAMPSSGRTATAASRCSLRLLMAKPPSCPRSRSPVNRRRDRRRHPRDLRAGRRPGPLRDVAPPPDVPGHRQPDDHADDDVLRVTVDVQQHRSVTDLLDEEGADDRAGYGPLAAEQAGAADDGRRDRVKLQADAEVRLAGLDPGRGDHPGKSRETARQHAHQDQVGTDPPTCQPGRLLVRADGARMAPELRPHEDHAEDDDDHDEADRGHRDGAGVALPEHREPGGHAVDRHRSGSEEGNPAGDAHHAQGGDERGELDPADQPAVHEPCQCT